MKKSKLSIGLVTSFIGALALTSCGSDAPAVTPSNNSVIDFIGYNTEAGRLEINVGELYREFGESKDGTTKYYNAILESLIRYEYPLLAADVDPKEPDLKKYSRILSEANDEVTKRKGVAQKNAENNDTDFDEEWQKILDSNDVDSEEDLRLKFVYEKEQDAIKDWYFKKHYESTSSVVGLRQEYLGVDKDWEQVVPTTDVDPVYPYHVIHILVKLSADASDYTRASISEAEAKKLWEIVKQLVDGQYTFEETAKLSDDTSSSEYGDVELMSTRTSFYNEFKLGTWAYDAILSEVNSETTEVENIYKAYGLDSSATVVTKTMNDAGHIDETEENVQDLIHETMLDKVNIHMEAAQKLLPAIPFDVFRQIGLKAEDDKIGTFSPEGGSASLPRNVLFNAFLNFRSPFVITNELLDETSVSYDDKDTEDKSDDVIDSNIATIPYELDDPSIFAVEKHNFKAGKLGATGTEFGTKKVLCDTNGNVVIGVRSTAGIHFMVMRKSVFYNTNDRAYEKAVYDSTGEIIPSESVKKTNTSIEDYYYTAKIPTDKDYSHDHETYVNIKDVTDSSYYTNRVNTIKNDVKSSNFDAAYDYRIYETLLSYPLYGGTKPTVGDNIHFSDEDPVTHKSVIKSNIEKTIAQLRENAKYSQNESINNAWKEYLIQLMNQNELRSDSGMYKGAFVPTTCAFSFKRGNEKDWKEGGKCYVK